MKERNNNSVSIQDSNKIPTASPTLSGCRNKMVLRATVVSARSSDSVTDSTIGKFDPKNKRVGWPQICVSSPIGYS